MARNDTPDTSRWGISTKLVRGGLERTPYEETSEALFLTSGYVYEHAADAEAAFMGDLDRYVYSRYGNPTVTMFEQRLALIEGAEACRSTASGMAAMFAGLACQLRSGDRIVAARALFGSCLHVVKEILPRWGIVTDLVDGGDMEAWKAALSTPAKVVFLESPSNPTLDVVDLEALAPIAHAAGARVVVDNVFATPILQRPLEYGADVVCYSTTKHIDGQGRTLGGAVLGSKEFVEKELVPFLRNTGPAMSPFNAWVALKGLETLDLRVRKQTETAGRLARWLKEQPGVTLVRYPGLEDDPSHAIASRQMDGFGTLVTFEIDGDKTQAFTMLDSLRLIDISNNLGDAKSLICHPATSTHSKVSPEDKALLGITPGLIRLSVGLEDYADLAGDLDQALAAAGLAR